MMNVKEMIEKSRKNAKKRTPQERLAFLQRANILDEKRHYKTDFFSSKTVNASRKAHPIIA